MDAKIRGSRESKIEIATCAYFKIFFVTVDDNCS